MFKKIFVILHLFLLSTGCTAQNQVMDSREKTYVSHFENFIQALAVADINNENITDSFHLKHLLLSYLFAGTMLDSSNKNLSAKELNSEKLLSVKKQLKTFSAFIQTRKGYINALPIRLWSNKSVYHQLSDFQQKNTLVFFDKRSPGKILGYLLFIPPLDKVIAAPRIWSWILTFQYGKYMFHSVTGEDGYEYMFSAK